MHDRIMHYLQQLETTMKNIGWWQTDPPPPSAFNSQAPFCIDSMTFSEWLQWVYIPKTRSLILAGAALPPRSGLLPIAEEAWRGKEAEAADLIRYIAAIDDTILKANAQP